MRSLSRRGWYQFISLMHLHGVLSLKDTDYWTPRLRGKCVRRIHIMYRDGGPSAHCASSMLPGHRQQQTQELCKLACTYSKGPEDAAVHFEKHRGRNPVSICKQFAWPNVSGCILERFVLMVSWHKSKEGAGRKKTKNKKKQQQQRDVASGLGIFLEKNAP